MNKMKKFITVLVLLLSLTMFSQTTIDLSGMTEDITLGQNCSQSQTPEEFVTTGDANLNGFTINLKNSNLTVTGNLNGNGEIEGCGQSSLCVNGATQNNPNIEDGLDCNTLSNNEVELTPVFSFSNVTKTIKIHNSTFIHVYSMTGQLVLESKGDTLRFEGLPTGIYIFKGDNLTRKLPVN